MLIPNSPVPELDLPLVNGMRFNLADQSPENFTLLVFYRGKHCPICKGQLEDMGSKLADLTGAGLAPFAISMDDADRVQVTKEEWETGDLPIAYGLTEAQAREWGLYISEKREGSEEPAVFSEPGLFLIRPDGTLFFTSIQSAPFTRPPLDELIEGVNYVVKNDYPARGTLT